MDWQVEREKKLHEDLDDSSPLDCDICGKHICYVHDFDLNESYFFCDECKAKSEVKS